MTSSPRAKSCATLHAQCGSHVLIQHNNIKDYFSSYQQPSISTSLHLQTHNIPQDSTKMAPKLLKDDSWTNYVKSMKETSIAAVSSNPGRVPSLTYRNKNEPEQLEVESTKVTIDESDQTKLAVTDYDSHEGEEKITDSGDNVTLAGSEYFDVEAAEVKSNEADAVAINTNNEVDTKVFKDVEGKADEIKNAEFMDAEVKGTEVKEAEINNVNDVELVKDVGPVRPLTFHQPTLDLLEGRAGRWPEPKTEVAQKLGGTIGQDHTSISCRAAIISSSYDLDMHALTFPPRCRR